MSEWTDAHQRLYDAAERDPRVAAQLTAAANKVKAQARVADPAQRLRDNDPVTYGRLRQDAEQIVDEQERRRQQRVDEQQRKEAQLAEAKQWAAEMQQAYFYNNRR